MCAPTSNKEPDIGEFGKVKREFNKVPDIGQVAAQFKCILSIFLVFIQICHCKKF